MKVVALLPAFNEAESIVQTFTPALELKCIDQIVVIDDGSQDDTFALASSVAKDQRIMVLRLPKNRGKGGALNRGLEQFQAEIYLLLDADLGTTASLASALLEPILQSQADMTIARFSAKQSESPAKMGFGLVRRTAALGVRWLTGERVTSPLSGQRAVRGEVLQTLGGFFEGFGVEVGLTVGALYHGYRVLEVPLPMKHRAYGRGLRGLRHRSNQLLQVMKALWECWKKGWHV